MKTNEKDPKMKKSQKKVQKNIKTPINKKNMKFRPKKSQERNG